MRMMSLDISSILKRGLPVIVWSKSYTMDSGLADLVAGITIGLTLIPQCIAYASLAGLGPEYGLYSSLVGGMTYVIFGTVPELSIAPTALLSLLTFTFTNDATYGNAHAAVLLCFLAGTVELLCGILHLGFLVDFVSTPVVAAFTSAGALTIASSQVKNLLGLHFSAESFYSVWSNVFARITETKKWDALLGFACCVVLLLMKKLKDFGVPPLSNPELPKVQASSIKKLIWFCSVARNALVVIGCAAIAYVLASNEIVPFSLTSEVPAGLPDFSSPIGDVQNGNTTVTAIETVAELGIGVLVVPFVAILSNVAIAKAFARGSITDASQEMIAVGMCSLIGSFFGSYPVNASFSRAAVSNQSGVRTPLAGIYAGVIVVLALTYLTPYFSYIPKPTLAAVIICAVLFMVEVTVIKIIWEVNKIDLVPFVVTLIACLILSIEIGILFGVCVDIIFVLYETARPKTLIEKVVRSDYGNSYVKVTPTSAIWFPAAEYVRTKILRDVDTQNFDCRFLVLDCQQINKIDFTATKCLLDFMSDLKKLDKQVVFYRPGDKLSKILIKATKTNANIAKTEAELKQILEGQLSGSMEIYIGGSRVDITQM